MSCINTSTSRLTLRDLKYVASQIDSVPEPEVSSLATAIDRVMGTPENVAALSPASLGAAVWGDRWRNARHIDLIDDWLCRMADREIRRLMVWMPPQHGKSTMITQFFPAWYLGIEPTHRAIIATYGHQFSSRWGRAVRDIIREYGPKIFNVTLREDVQSAHEWELTAGGGILATGVGGPITGHRADLLVIDDPVKNAEQAISEVYREKVWEWWISSARTRLRPDGLVVIVQTRWHEDDLSGRILRQTDEQWEVVNLQAIAEQGDVLGREVGEPLWPEVYDREYLEKIKATSPAYWWQAMYQQRPTQHESVLWPPEYFEGQDIWFDEWPDDSQFVIKTLALDPSRGVGGKIGDYSAYIMLGIDRKANLWVDADMSNTRAGKEIVADGGAICSWFHPDVFGVESNAFQELFGPMFVTEFRQRRMAGFEPIMLENRVKKEMRVERLDQWFRDRLVRFRRSRGCEILLDQLKNFPVGLHDDGPDAMEMAVRLADENLEKQTELRSNVFAGGLG